jgi:hypothetical protein
MIKSKFLLQCKLITAEGLVRFFIKYFDYYDHWGTTHMRCKNSSFFCLLYRALKSIVGLYLINPSDYMQYGNINWNDIRVILKSCPVGPELHLSFDASSPPGCCPQSHEILSNKGMKYGDSGLNAPGLRTFIVPVHIQLLDFTRDNVCSYLRF